jgi:hypothetical protein
MYIPNELYERRRMCLITNIYILIFAYLRVCARVCAMYITLYAIYIREHIVNESHCYNIDISVIRANGRRRMTADTCTRYNNIHVPTYYPAHNINKYIMLLFNIL